MMSGKLIKFDAEPVAFLGENIFVESWPSNSDIFFIILKLKLLKGYAGICRGVFSSEIPAILISTDNE